MGCVSLVVVSHSRLLADGLVELLRPFSDEHVHIGVAAGVGGELGTDAIAVVRALQDCPPDSDIVVVFDLGSALLSCETALELVPEALRRRVALLDAPLVEGAIAAVVETGLGRPLPDVVKNAERASRVRKLPSSPEDREE
jgi:phosphoenolpyruvate---glycerone phosphotransferase subunit DhaM